MQTQTTLTIRDRWQITIPYEIRRFLDWAKPRSIASAIVTSKKELVIKPFIFTVEKKVDWDAVWKAIREARAISAKGKNISLSRFILKDRERHT